MKKNTLLLTVLFLFCTTAFSKPLLTKGSYLIACLANGTTGAVSLGTEVYNLAYSPSKNVQTAGKSEFWTIMELGDGHYAFQNASSHQFIKFQPDAPDRVALKLTDSLQSDGTTSWILEAKMIDNRCYYIIKSVYNSTKIWNKRAVSYDGIYPVGTYSQTGEELEYFVFYDLNGNAVKDDKATAVRLPAFIQSLGAFTGQLDSLTIGGKVPAVDLASKRIYITLPDSLLVANDVSLKVFYLPKNKACQLYIGGVLVESGSNYTFPKVTGTSSVVIQVRNGTTELTTGTISFSSLPFVQLYSGTPLTQTYSLGKVVVTEPGKPGLSEYLTADLRIRGAIATNFDKKPLAVKLKDNDGISPLNRSFFGLRSDNKWVLDAMAIDRSRMRNRVTTDLWNDFSTKPYWSAQEPDMLNGTRGHYVEVFMNDQYCGLYCMTEKIDRKQLNLKKYHTATDSTPALQHGALFKVDEWSLESQMGNTKTEFVNYTGFLVRSYDNASPDWCSYACKYPDMSQGEPIDWKTMYDAVCLCSDQTSDAVFVANVQKQFDLPVIRDYYLLMELILAADNQGKNIYFSACDQAVSTKLSITPWDLDATWGRRWDGTSGLTVPRQNFDSYLTKYEHGQNNLFRRLKKLNPGGFNQMLSSRYKELRGTYFSYSSLMGRFKKYLTMLKKSGAFSREQALWGNSWIKVDSNFDLAFLSNWISERLSYLDNQYLGKPYVDTLKK
jgi:hypothetical protein